MKTRERNKLEKFEEIIDVEFKDFSLIKEALTHRSYINEANEDNINHNERLEFLGDAVLELVVTRYLFENYKEFEEGDLTSFRSALVRTESLADEATRLNFGEYLYMSKGEESTGGRERTYILANTVEAVIGAIYLDQDYDITKKFILKNICYKADEIIQNRTDIDSKSKLQEISQEQVKETPVYELIEEAGPDHDKIFTMTVRIGRHIFGTGKGKSKQEAEQEAALQAVKNWDKLYKEYFS